MNCEHIVSIMPTKSFLANTLPLCYDIAVFAPSVSSYSDALRVNELLYQNRKPFTQISFNGVKVVAGLLVVPDKSACLQCAVVRELKYLNTKLTYQNEKEITLDDLKFLNYSYNAPTNFAGLSIPHIVDVLLEDITRFCNGLSSKFLDMQYFFDSELLNYSRHGVLPTTYCDFCCAINKNYRKVDSNFSLSIGFDETLGGLTKTDIKYQVGGLRSKTEAETREILDAELAKFGARILIEAGHGNHFNDSGMVHCYNAVIDQVGNEMMPHIFRKDSASGKGLTQSQSYFSAAFELLEHIGLQYTGNVPIICAKYVDVKQYAIDMPYLASTVMNKFTAYDCFDENVEIDWVVASSLTGGGQKLVPAFLVFMFDVEVKGALFSPSSNGAAAGVTLEDAILHGLFEAIERDAFVLGNSNPYILPLVDYKSVKNAKIRELASKAKDMGYDIITRDYTNDLGIPVYRTWIVNRGNYSKYAYTGTGCNISPELALERSITEAVQTNDKSDYGGDAEPAMMTQEVLLKSQVNLYNQHFLINKDVLGISDKLVQIGASIFEMESSFEIIKKVAEQVKKKVGGDVYYVDLTKPGMDVKVVRVIITGDIQLLNIPLISASKRIFEFGIRCGYSDKKSTYEELFMGNYQI